MTIIGIDKKIHQELANKHRAALLELAETKTTLEKKEVECQHITKCYKDWRAEAEKAAQAICQAQARVATAEKERDRVKATIASFGKATEGWHCFGSDEWIALDMIFKFHTSKERNGEYDVLVVDGYNGTESLPEPYLTLEEFFAILNARRKGKFGGGGSEYSDDSLPNAPLAPKLAPRPPVSGISR